MAYNRELSQFSSFVEIDDSSKNISIAPNAAQNVGLGLTNPTSKLQVTGDVNISGATTTVRFTATNATASYLSGISLNYSGISTFSSLVVSGISTFNDQVDIYSNVSIQGSVGINTTIYDSTFVIASAGESSSELMCLDGTSNSNRYGLFSQYANETTITSRNGNNYGTIKLNQYDGSTVQTSITIPPSGNVGVGSTLPSSKLTVDGNVNVSGIVTAPTFVGNLTGTATTATTVDILNTNGLTTVYYPTFVESRTDGQIVRADVDLTYRTDDNILTVPNINLSSSGLSVGTGGTVITTTSNGFVGVRTTNPEFLLQVGSAGAAGTSLYVNGDARITGVLSIGTSTITLDPSNNQIGIGTQLMIDANAGSIIVGSNEIVNSAGNANFTGFVTALSISSNGALSGAYYSEPHSVDNGLPIEIGVAVSTKTVNHRYYGSGSIQSYYFDGVEAPYLVFLPGKTYRFNEENVFPDRIKFYTDEAKTSEYTTGVTVSNIPKYTEISVTEETPSILYYDTSSILDYKGNQIIVQASTTSVGDFYRYKNNNELLTVGIGSTTFPGLSPAFSAVVAGVDYDSLFYVTDPSSTNRLAVIPSNPNSILLENSIVAAFKVNQSEAYLTAFDTGVGISTQRSSISLYSDVDTRLIANDSSIRISSNNGVNLLGVSTNTFYLKNASLGSSYYGHFQTNVSLGGTFQTTIFNDLYVTGALSKGSGSFKIDHPLESKKDTHYLVHSFIEGPQADLIYRGKVNLVNGSASINIDQVSEMTEGTFESLCRDVQCFTTNESGWDPVKGTVSGNILTIQCKNSNSSDSISWIVIGERKDPHMINTEWTDNNGKVIVEVQKNSQNTPVISEITQV